MLPALCRPCIRIVHRATRRAVRTLRHPLHHAARHPGKWIIAACCVGTLGPLGGTLPAPPASAPLEVHAPAPAWPDTPVYGGGAVPIPTYSSARPELLDVQPNLSNVPRHTSYRTPPASIPEPASAALLLVPMVGLAIIRRTCT